MRRLTILVATAIGIAVGTGFVEGVSSLTPGSNRPAQEPAAKTGEFQSPFFAFNKKAERVMKKPSASQKEMEDLVDEILNNVQFFVFPEVLKATLRKKVVAAELRYRHGGPGVKEANIIRAINELADDCQAPPFIKTSESQLRVLRADLAVMVPALVTPPESKVEPDALPSQSGPVTTNKDLAPLEAAYILGTMLFQKARNEEYQFTPEEWPEEFRQRQARKLENPKQGSSFEFRAVQQSPEMIRKQDEVQATMERLAHRKQTEMTAILTKLFVNLGIDR